MEYVIYKDFNCKAICGEVNLPKGTICTEKDGMLYHEDKPLCLKASQRAFDFFARNHDGKGMKRGELISTIKEILALVDEHRYERWYRIWNDPACKQFNKGGEYWTWNYAFYNAEIYILQYIHNLVTDENWLGLIDPTLDNDAFIAEYEKAIAVEEIENNSEEVTE